jgi:DNA mismatch repair protein MutH
VSLRIAILLGYTDYGSRTGSKLVHVGVEMKTLPVEAIGLSSTLA